MGQTLCARLPCHGVSQVGITSNDTKNSQSYMRKCHEQRALKKVVDLTIGHKERSKAQRGARPSKEVLALEKTFQERGLLTVPYRDPRDGSLVLYEESFAWYQHFCTRASHFYELWDKLPWWARDIGFRVVRRDQPSAISIATSLPPELLLHIFDLGQWGADKDHVSRLALTCRAWSANRQQLLFLQPTSRFNTRMLEREVPNYVHLVAQYAKKWRLYNDAEVSPPGWLRRSLALYTTARKRLPESKRQHPTAEVVVSINFKKILLACPRSQCRSIFPLCPRSLPPSGMPTLDSLSLDDHHFHSFSDLVHLLWELPQLRSLSCKDVSWEAFDVLPPPALRTQQADGFGVLVERCKDAAPFVLLTTSVFGIQSGEARGILSDLCVHPIVELVRCALPCLSGHYCVFSRDGRFCKINYRGGSRILLFELKQGPITAPNDLRIAVTDLFLDASREEQRPSQMETVGKTLRLLTNAGIVDEMVRVTFRTTAEDWDRCPILATPIASQLPRIWELGQLGFLREKGELFVGNWERDREAEEFVPEFP